MPVRWQPTSLVAVRRKAEERALWDYRLDVGRSVRSYFIVCKVPKSVLSSLAAKSLALGPEDASTALRELAEGGVRRRRDDAVWQGGGGCARGRWSAPPCASGMGRWCEANGRRWCTVLLPVDCFTDLLVAPPDSAKPRASARTYSPSTLPGGSRGRQTLTISPCAVECKYVSATYPASTVQDALGQAEATYQVVSQLFSLARSEVRNARATCALPHPAVRPPAPCRAEGRDDGRRASHP